MKTRLVTTSISELESLLAFARKHANQDGLFDFSIVRDTDGINDYCIHWSNHDGMPANTTSLGKQCNKLQIDIAAKLEDIYHMMHTVDEMRKFRLTDNAKDALLHFPNALFEFVDINGYMEIKPRPLNFDPVKK